jgi:hypothetical protein
MDKKSEGEFGGICLRKDDTPLDIEKDAQNRTFSFQIYEVKLGFGAKL